MKSLYMLLGISIFFTGCKSSNIQKTMDDFVEISSTASGSQVQMIKMKQCCIPGFKSESESLKTEREKRLKGGFFYAPYIYLMEEKELKIENLKLVKVEEISSNKVIATFGNKSFQLSGPMESIDSKWLFCLGEVKLFLMEGGKPVLVDPDIYINWFEKRAEEFRKAFENI